MSESVAKPIGIVSSNLRKYAEGDFTAEIPKKFLNRKDEIGERAGSLNSMKKSLSTPIKEVGNCSNNLKY
ncbi:hypothetical protein ACYUJ6_05695 [Clostridium sp. JNZ X4-2]